MTRRFKVIDRIRVNISCDLTIKMFLIMERGCMMDENSVMND